MIPDPEKLRFWEARATAYDRLCERWEIFSLLSNRLIDLLPADLEGPVLDIGAGSGLTSELLLDITKHPLGLGQRQIRVSSALRTVCLYVLLAWSRFGAPGNFRRR